MKKWIWIAIIILVPIAYYLISPIFNVVEVNEESPFEVLDSLDAMDDATRTQFDKEVEVMKDTILEMNDAMPSGPKLLSQSEFKPRAHEVEGVAKLVELSGKKILRFEDFETINGPELRIYLSTSLGNDDFVDLGKIKATKGNVNYAIPSDVDTDKYNKVLVWCKPFGVLFSYADLQQK